MPQYGRHEDEPLAYHYLRSWRLQQIALPVARPPILEGSYCMLDMFEQGMGPSLGALDNRNLKRP